MLTIAENQRIETAILESRITALEGIIALSGLDREYPAPVVYPNRAPRPGEHFGNYPDPDDPFGD